VNEQVQRAVNLEREKIKEKIEAFEEVKTQLQNEKDTVRNLTDLLEEKEAIINKYKQELQKVAKQFPDEYKIADRMLEIDNFKEDRVVNTKQLQKLVRLKNIIIFRRLNLF
jgi:hypothetical protein